MGSADISCVSLLTLGVRGRAIPLGSTMATLPVNFQSPNCTESNRHTRASIVQLLAHKAGTGMGRMDTRKACLNCRQRHLRCDRELPSCRRCRLSGLICDHRVVHSFRNVSFHGHRSPAGLGGDIVPSVGQGQSRRPEDGGAQPLFVDETDLVIEAHRKRTPQAQEEQDQRNVGASEVSQSRIIPIKLILAYSSHEISAIEPLTVCYIFFQ